MQKNKKTNIVAHALENWASAGVSHCKRKFVSKPDVSVKYIEDVTLNPNNGQQIVSWHCSGIRRHSQSQFLNPKNFIIFHVDTVNREGNLTLAQVPSSLQLFGEGYKLHSATLWNGTHYICTFSLNGQWYLYDGIKEIILEILHFRFVILDLMNL